MMSDPAPKPTHRVAIHTYAFGYRVDPGKLKVTRTDEDQPVVRFTNLTDKDIVLEFPDGLFSKEARSVALGAFRREGYRQDFALIADEGDYEYAAVVTAAGIEAEGSSRPRILVER